MVAPQWPFGNVIRTDIGQIRQASEGLFFDVKDFGAVADGVTDDSQAFSAWWDALRVSGGAGVIPAGQYLLASQVTLQNWTRSVGITAYGTEIITQGAISGLAIRGASDTVSPLSIYGLRVNHRGNASATFGFDVAGAWNVRLYDPVVVAHGVSSTYSAFRWAQSDASDPATGAFWGKIINPWVRKLSGADVGEITIGVLVEGASNACSIRGGGLNNCVSGILVRDQAGGDGRVPNAVVIDDVAFEAYTTAIHLTSSVATANISGFRVVNNRFENGTTVFSVTGITTQPSVSPWLEGNHLISDAGTYVNNPNSLRINRFDFSETPDIGVPELFRGLAVQPLGGSEEPIDIRGAGGARGIHVRSAGAGSTQALIASRDSGTRGRLRSAIAAEMFLSTIRGLSQTATDAENLRGSATFATAATVAVTFATAESDANYFVSISGDTNETFWITAKGTAGFTINSSNASSTATVDWHIIR